MLESGSKGIESDFEFKTDSAVLTEILTAGDTGASATTAVTNGTATYNGDTVNAASTFKVKIGDVLMGADTTANITNGTTSMASAVTILENSINSAIAQYNSNVLGGAQSGDEGFVEDVKVNALEDGRIEIISESGAISFSDYDGETTVADLGLDAASTSSSGNGGMTFQIGGNQGQTINFGISDMRGQALGISSLDISSQAGAESAITKIDDAIKTVSSERSKLGAIQNRLEHTINNLSTSSENLTAAESRIRDVDMAKEMMQFTKLNILSQAAQSMLAQANQQPQGVLQLLQ